MSNHHRSVPSAGVEPGERQLNGPQTTGRDYSNLSEPSYRTVREDDVAVLMRDGAKLLADVHRPATTGASRRWCARRRIRARSRTSAHRWGSSRRERATSSFPGATCT